MQQLKQSVSITAIDPTSHQFRLQWLQLARTKNVTPRIFAKLIEMFGHPELALQELPNLTKRGSAGSNNGGNNKNFVKSASLSSIEREIIATQKFGAKIILSCDQGYPQLLRTIPDHPPAIVVKGNHTLLTAPILAIVGARNASTNGCIIAKNLASELSSQNAHIICSGLARGVDAAAHIGSMKNGTIGVIAGGIDNIYPKENTDLYEQLYEQGLVLTEHSIGTAPIAQYFPQRNRIISGLSIATIIVEAAQKSGTLITARLALDQGRDVFAVPGSPLDQRCRGTNGLIKQGAVLVENANDIINALNTSKFYDMGMFHEHGGCYECIRRPKIREFNPQELEKHRKILLSKLSHTPVNMDLLRESASEIPQHILTLLLLELELAGRIEYCYGNSICLLQQE
jgi:DNA processing protein